MEILKKQFKNECQLDFFRQPSLCFDAIFLLSNVMCFFNAPFYYCENFVNLFLSFHLATIEWIKT